MSDDFSLNNSASCSFASDFSKPPPLLYASKSALPFWSVNLPFILGLVKISPASFSKPLPINQSKAKFWFDGNVKSVSRVTLLVSFAFELRLYDVP